MKTAKAIILLLCIAAGSGRVSAQDQEMAQLLLNIEKLAQYKQILSDLKKGYEILSKGYNTVKNISEGNFNMHKTFLDGLYVVSPEVKKYRRAVQIIEYQVILVKEYKTAYNRFRNKGVFSSGEIMYLAQVYKRLFDASLRNIDELTMIMTSGKLRMSDDERLKAIDAIYVDMQDKVMFLRYFNNQTSVLALQRDKVKNDIDASRKVQGINR